MMRKLLIGGVAALAAITFAPLAQADGNAANLDQLVGSAYTQFQHGCTPSMSPQFQRIQWDSPPGDQGLDHRQLTKNAVSPRQTGLPCCPSFAPLYQRRQGWRAEIDALFRERAARHNPPQQQQPQRQTLNQAPRAGADYFDRVAPAIETVARLEDGAALLTCGDTRR